MSSSEGGPTFHRQIKEYPVETSSLPQASLAGANRWLVTQLKDSTFRDYDHMKGVLMLSPSQVGSLAEAGGIFEQILARFPAMVQFLDRPVLMDIYQQFMGLESLKAYKLDPAGIKAAIHAASQASAQYFLLNARSNAAGSDDPSFFFNTMGSRSGAFGMPQFMPMNLTVARDGDGDKKVDLRNLSDAVASVASYFQTRGCSWSDHRSWGAHLRTYNSSDVYVVKVLEIARSLMDRRTPPEVSTAIDKLWEGIRTEAAPPPNKPPR